MAIPWPTPTHIEAIPKRLSLRLSSRVSVTIIRELRRTESRFGIASMCVGVGQGIAMLVERVES